MDNHKDTPSDKIHEAAIVNNEYAREIWNKAIEKAALTCYNGDLLEIHSPRIVAEIRKLKV